MSPLRILRVAAAGAGLVGLGIGAGFAVTAETANSDAGCDPTNVCEVDVERRLLLRRRTRASFYFDVERAPLSASPPPPAFATTLPPRVERERHFWLWSTKHRPVSSSFFGGTVLGARAPRALRRGVDLRALAPVTAQLTGASAHWVPSFLREERPSSSLCRTSAKEQRGRRVRA